LDTLTASLGDEKSHIVSTYTYTYTSIRLFTPKRQRRHTKPQPEQQLLVYIYNNDSGRACQLLYNGHGRVANNGEGFSLMHCIVVVNQYKYLLKREGNKSVAKTLENNQVPNVAQWNIKGN